LFNIFEKSTKNEVLQQWLDPEIELCKSLGYTKICFCIIQVKHFFSDGIGWTAKQQKIIEDLGDDFELNKSQFKLTFTFEEDHTFEMFTQDVQNRSRLGHKSFTFFLLTQEGNPENAWQQFKCPMKFPQCSYNWCINGENRSVTKS
jgi:hypothetical protein